MSSNHDDDAPIRRVSQRIAAQRASRTRISVKTLQGLGMPQPERQGQGEAEHCTPQRDTLAFIYSPSAVHGGKIIRSTTCDMGEMPFDTMRCSLESGFDLSFSPTPEKSRPATEPAQQQRGHGHGCAISTPPIYRLGNGQCDDHSEVVTCDDGIDDAESIGTIDLRCAMDGVTEFSTSPINFGADFFSFSPQKNEAPPSRMTVTSPAAFSSTSVIDITGDSAYPVTCLDRESPHEGIESSLSPIPLTADRDPTVGPMSSDGLFPEDFAELQFLPLIAEVETNSSASGGDGNGMCEGGCECRDGPEDSGTTRLGHEQKRGDKGVDGMGKIDRERSKARVTNERTDGINMEHFHNVSPQDKSNAVSAASGIKASLDCDRRQHNGEEASGATGHNHLGVGCIACGELAEELVRLRNERIFLLGRIQALERDLFELKAAQGKAAPWEKGSCAVDAPPDLKRDMIAREAPPAAVTAAAAAALAREVVELTRTPVGCTSPSPSTLQSCVSLAFVGDDGTAEPPHTPVSAISIRRIRWNGGSGGCDRTASSPIPPFSPGLLLRNPGLFPILSPGSLVRHAEARLAALRVVDLDAGASHEVVTSVAESTAIVATTCENTSSPSQIVCDTLAARETHADSLSLVEAVASCSSSARAASTDRVITSPCSASPRGRGRDESDESIHSAPRLRSTATSIISATVQRSSTPGAATIGTTAPLGSPEPASEEPPKTDTARHVPSDKSAQHMSSVTSEAKTGSSPEVAPATADANKLSVWDRLHASPKRIARSPGASGSDTNMPPPSPRTPSVAKVSPRPKLAFGSASSNRSPLGVLAGINSSGTVREAVGKKKLSMTSTISRSGIDHESDGDVPMRATGEKPMSRASGVGGVGIRSKTTVGRGSLGTKMAVGNIEKQRAEKVMEKGKPASRAVTRTGPAPHVDEALIRSKTAVTVVREGKPRPRGGAARRETASPSTSKAVGVSGRVGGTASCKTRGKMAAAATVSEKKPSPRDGAGGATVAPPISKATGLSGRVGGKASHNTRSKAKTVRAQAIPLTSTTGSASRDIAAAAAPSRVVTRTATRTWKATEGATSASASVSVPRRAEVAKVAKVAEAGERRRGAKAAVVPTTAETNVWSGRLRKKDAYTTEQTPTMGKRPANATAATTTTRARAAVEAEIADAFDARTAGLNRYGLRSKGAAGGRSATDTARPRWSR